MHGNLAVQMDGDLFKEFSVLRNIRRIRSSKDQNSSVVFLYAICYNVGRLIQNINGGQICENNNRR